MYKHSSSCSITPRCFISISSRRSHITPFSPRLAKIGEFATFIQGICGRQRGSSIMDGHRRPSRTFDPSLRPVCSSHQLVLRNTNWNSFISEAQGMSKKAPSYTLCPHHSQRGIRLLSLPPPDCCQKSAFQRRLHFKAKQNETLVPQDTAAFFFFFLLFSVVYTRYSSTETVTPLRPPDTATSVCANAQEQIILHPSRKQSFVERLKHLTLSELSASWQRLVFVLIQLIRSNYSWHFQLPL